MKAFATGALLVLPLVFVALAGGADAATSWSLTISTATAHPQVPFQNFDGNPPKLFDVNGDGQLEIIAQFRATNDAGNAALSDSYVWG